MYTDYKDVVWDTDRLDIYLDICEIPLVLSNFCAFEEFLYILIASILIEFLYTLMQQTIESVLNNDD